MSLRVRTAAALISLAKRSLESGWARSRSKEAESEAIASLAKAKEALQK